jgi:Asparagine synthase
VFFSLAISAATPALCDALADRARIADPSVMPIPGPALIAWRSPDRRTALLHWGGTGPSRLAQGTSGSSQAETIWTGEPTPGSGRAPVYARTSVTRVDPVYVAEVPGAVVVADRAMWAAWTVSRLDDHDPLHACALLNPGFPLGSGTPFTGVSALAQSTTLYLMGGEAQRTPTPTTAARDDAGPERSGGARAVADALVAAIAPLRDSGRPVELSLTGGKDSRLIAAALVKAGVPVVARTHGFADHPDVVVAAQIARRLGIEHMVRTPAAPGQEVDVLGRIRATVLVADGMLSAFENVGRPDPTVSPAVTAGGHGGELLRGGYAETAAGKPGSAGGLRGALDPARRAARSAELLRRLTTKHLSLLRRGPATGYVASLAPWTPALTRHPLQALDDFYLVNRAGRWSAAARQAYLIRESLVQPLFDDQVVLSARAVPLADRVSGALSAAVLAELCPALTDIPLAGKPPVARAQPPAGAVDGVMGQGAAHASFDWRRQYGETIAVFLRGYVLDLGAGGGLFDVVSRRAAEKLLAGPQADRASVWALATLACLLSGDFRHARGTTPQLTVS